MSKSRGNVVAPMTWWQPMARMAVRAYLVTRTLVDGGPWSRTGIEGSNRWLRRVWNTLLEEADHTAVDDGAVRALRRKLHQTLRAVSRDFEELEFNTIISALMELMNEMARLKPHTTGAPAWDEAVDIYLRMLAPVAPPISEEIWSRLGKPYSVLPSLGQWWMKPPPLKMRLCCRCRLTANCATASAAGECERGRRQSRGAESEVVQKFLEGKPPRQVIYVKGRLINIVA